MNTRCYRCGWSFSLGREAVETAVAAALASGAKVHVEYCPRCRQVIKMPVDQLRRSLPPGWTPPEAGEASAAAPAESTPAATRPAQAAAEANGAPEAEPAARPRRRRGSAAKQGRESTDEAAPEPSARSRKSAADRPAASKPTRKQSKP